MREKGNEAICAAWVSRDKRTTFIGRATMTSSTKTILLLVYWFLGLGKADAGIGEGDG